MRTLTNLKNRIRIIICLPWSIVFNFYYLPFRQAIKLPILFSVIPTFLSLRGGKVKIEGNICTGMIRIGEKFAPFYNRNKFRWQNSGTVIFKGKISFGHHSFICVGSNGQLEIGDRSTFSHGLKLICYNKIVFGEQSRISWGCTIMDTDFHPLIDMIRKKTIPESASIIMGKGVWIGHDCIISKGCRLPENATVSSGTVVKGRFKKPNAILIGNPAVIMDEGYKRDDV